MWYHEKTYGHNGWPDSKTDVYNYMLLSLFSFCAFVLLRYLDDAQNNLSFSALNDADKEKLKKILSYGLASEFKCLK